MDHRVLFRALACLLSWGALLSPRWSIAQPSENTRPLSTLTRDQAIVRALRSSPTLDMSAATVAAARGRLRQAAARPNPTLSADAEDLALDGGPLDALELTIRGEHVFELGGKRAARRSIADGDLEEAALLLAADSTAVRAETRLRYAQAQAAQRRVLIAEQNLAIANELSSSVGRRVEAGAVSPAEGSRARAEVARGRLELHQSRVEASTFQSRLVSLWGGSEGEATELEPIRDSLPDLPSIESLDRMGARSASIRALESRVRTQDSRIRMQKSLASPDLGVSGGIRTNRGSGDESLVAGLSVPLPLFDRNAGNVAAAEAERAKVIAELAAAKRDQRLALGELLATVESARAVRESLRSEVLPEATRALDEIMSGYLRGRFNYVDVLEARRSVLTASQAEIHAFLTYSDAAARLERVLGVDVGDSAFDSKE